MNSGSTLLNLGLDSLMTAEIRQILDSNIDRTLNIKQIQQLTFSDIKGMLDTPNENVSNVKVVLPKQILTKIKECEGGYDGPDLFVIHHVFGTLDDVDFMSHLRCSVYVIQCDQSTPLTSIENMAKHYIKVCKLLSKILNFHFQIHYLFLAK